MATDPTQGGLFQLTKGAVIGLRREHWGYPAQIPTKFDPQTGKPIEFQPHDPGVQNPVDELVSRLSSDAPIQLDKSFTLIGPANAPAMTIIDGGGGTIQYITENITNVINEAITTGFTGTVQVMTNATVGIGTLAATIGTLAVSAGTLAVSISVSGCTATATVTGSPSLTGTPGLTGSPSITPTYITLTFENGVLISAA